MQEERAGIIGPVAKIWRRRLVHGGVDMRSPAIELDTADRGVLRM
jgi:hypothetical protein